MVIWLYGYMVIWLYGYMVIWLYGYMVIWLYGYMVIWLYGYMVIWLYGYMVIWLYGYMVIWLYGYMVIWLYGYMVIYMVYSFMMLHCHVRSNVYRCHQGFTTYGSYVTIVKHTHESIRQSCRTIWRFPKMEVPRTPKWLVYNGKSY